MNDNYKIYEQVESEDLYGDLDDADESMAE